MGDLSKRVDIVELKDDNYRRWRNDLEVALILAQCLPAAEHAAKPDNIDQAAWEVMQKNSRAIVIKALRDDFWRASPQDTTFEILRKVQDAKQPTSSLIAVLNICKFFSLTKSVMKPDDAIREITAAFAEMHRSIQASDFMRNRVVIDEAVRIAILAFSIEKTVPTASQQIKERFERNAITFEQATSLIAEVKVTADTSTSSSSSSSATPFVGQTETKSTCGFCKRQHSIEKCWFRNPSLASEKIRAKGICKSCKIIGHHTKDCKKNMKDESKQDLNKQLGKKKHVFTVRHMALANSVPTEDAPPSIIIDSGCTTHMMYDRKLFSSYKDGPPNYAASVYTASGQSLSVAGYGSVTLAIENSRTKAMHDVQFSNVLHVPSLQQNILSVAVLDQKGIQLTTCNEKIILRHGNNFIASAHLSQESMQYNLLYCGVKRD